MRLWRTGHLAIVLIAALAGFFLLVTSCTPRPETAIGTAESPLVFVMSRSTTKGKEAQVEILRSLLQEESGLHIRIEIPQNSVSAIQLFSSRGADAGLLGPFEYLLARKVHGVEAGLRILRDGPSYQGTILVQADSDIQSIEDLRAKRIAYIDPYSMTGFVLPAARLKEAGVEMDAIYAGSHDEAVRMLEAGRVHAAATYLRRAEGELDRRGLRILETTGPVPNEPVFFRKDLSDDNRQALIKAFQAATANAQCQSALMDLFGCDGVAIVDDRAYDEFEKIATAAGAEVQSLVPGGWFVYHIAQEPFVTAP